MGKKDLPGQATVEVLGRFGKTISTSRAHYRSFVEDGVAMGHRNDLAGGSGRQRQSTSEHQEERGPLDSRVLGSGDFAEQLLSLAEMGVSTAKLPLEEIIERVCEKLALPQTELTSQTRAQQVAKARGIICHIAFACGHLLAAIAASILHAASASRAPASRWRRNGENKRSQGILSFL